MVREYQQESGATELHLIGASYGAMVAIRLVECFLEIRSIQLLALPLNLTDLSIRPMMYGAHGLILLHLDFFVPIIAKLVSWGAALKYPKGVPVASEYEIRANRRGGVSKVVSESLPFYPYWPGKAVGQYVLGVMHTVQALRKFPSDVLVTVMEGKRDPHALPVPWYFKRFFPGRDGNKTVWRKLDCQHFPALETPGEVVTSFLNTQREL